MHDDRRDIDPIEQALRELDEAKRSGLFTRTKVTAPMVQPIAPTLFLAMPSARRWMTAVAAVVVLALGVWTVMFGFQLSELRQRVQLASATGAAAPLQVVRSFSTCLAGPEGEAADGECREQDRNADGHVDLRDYSAFLLASAASSR